MSESRIGASPALSPSGPLTPRLAPTPAATPAPLARGPQAPRLNPDTAHTGQLSLAVPAGELDLESIDLGEGHHGEEGGVEHGGHHKEENSDLKGVQSLNESGKVLADVDEAIVFRREWKEAQEAKHAHHGEAPEEAAGGEAQHPAGEAPKAEAPHAEAPKAEAPRAEAPKAPAEAPRAEAPKAEAPHAEAPHAEAPKAEAPRAEAPKVEAPRAEAPATGAARPAAPAAEAPVAKPAAAPAAHGPAKPAPAPVEPVAVAAEGPAEAAVTTETPHGAAAGHGVPTDLTPWGRVGTGAAGAVGTAAGVFQIAEGFEQGHEAAEAWHEGHTGKAAVFGSAAVLNTAGGAGFTVQGGLMTGRAIVSAAGAGAQVVTRFGGAIEVAGKFAAPLTGAASVVTGTYQAFTAPDTEHKVTGSLKAIGGTLVLAGTAADCGVITAVAGVPMQAIGLTIIGVASVYENRHAIAHFAGNVAHGAAHLAGEAGHAIDHAAHATAHAVDHAAHVAAHAVADEVHREVETAKAVVHVADQAAHVVAHAVANEVHREVAVVSHAASAAVAWVKSIF